MEESPEQFTSLAHGEVVKREVTLTTAKGPLGKTWSRLIVTDSRVLFLAEAKNKLGSSRVLSELQISDVGNISHYVNRGLSSFAMVIAASLALISLFSLFANPVTGLIGLIITATILIFGQKSRAITFQIVSKSQGNPAITLAHETGGPLRSLISQSLRFLLFPVYKLLPKLGVIDASAAAAIRSTDEAEELFLELGALVLDLQNRGTLGG